MWDCRLKKLNQSLSQTEIAAAVGMSQNWVSGVIRGRIKTVRHNVGESILALENKLDQRAKRRLKRAA